MNHIGDVVCAIIEKDDLFLIAQRPDGHMLEKKWEFPGGKVASEESPHDAIKREIFEELNAVVKVNAALTPNNHSYDHLSLRLIPFRCSLIEGTPEPQEHSSIAWVNGETVKSYQFAGADIAILEEYLSIKSNE